MVSMYICVFCPPRRGLRGFGYYTHYEIVILYNL